MTEPTAAAVAVLALAAGHPLADDRCAELVPLFEAILGSAGRLRSLDLTGYEPPGPGSPAAG
jgi:hypothetical protein